MDFLNECNKNKDELDWKLMCADFELIKHLFTFNSSKIFFIFKSNVHKSMSLNYLENLDSNISESSAKRDPIWFYWRYNPLIFNTNWDSTRYYLVESLHPDYIVPLKN